jgi:hypothetical protein
MNSVHIRLFYFFSIHFNVILPYTPKNAMVRERTIPTERPPLVGEVIANFLRVEGATWSAWRIPTAAFSVFETGAATFLSSSSSVLLTRLSGPRSRPTTFFLLVPGIEPGPPDLQPRLWPLDHRGCPRIHLIPPDALFRSCFRIKTLHNLASHPSVLQTREIWTSSISPH